ncbi:MAG: uroporphyrinogen-III C-methyltransferase [Actinomycetota bacterium]|nr:uroporphyrinogen-III C-methyltransferase [Actinomycetota bacterium]
MNPGIAADLPVRNRHVAVAGASAQAITTTAALLDAGAVVSVFAPDPLPYFDDLAERGLLTLHRRHLSADDIDSAAAVFALTADPGQDRSIAALTERLNRICLVADPPPRSGRGTATAGRVIIVGGGPGDPGLLTLAGRDALADADVIVTDRLAPVGSLAALAPRAQLIDVSKIPGGRRTEQSTINRLLVEHASAGRTVVRFKGGDGFVFGRGGEELDHCVRAGVTVDVIPGVSASIAAPAAAQIPVTHRGLTQGFTVVSGHVPPGHPDSTIDYGALARVNTTIVLMMAVANLDAIATALAQAGMDPDTPAVVIADGCLPSQTQVRATLATIGAAARSARIGPPATTVIGEVAGFVAGIPVGAPVATMQA